MNDRKRTDDARPTGPTPNEADRATNTSGPQQSGQQSGEGRTSESTNAPKPKKQRRPKRQIKGSYL